MPGFKRKKEQLTLPYEVINPEQVAVRDYLRDQFKKGQIEYYDIPFERLAIRPGYNREILEEIEELAESLRSKNLKKPLTVDVLTDGRALIMRGERRYQAITMIRQNPRPTDVNTFDFVRCFVNSGAVTEFDRAVDLFIDNSGQSMHVLDQANKVKNLKINFGKELTSLEIAEAINVSRQKVDWLLIIADLDDETKNEIKRGNLSARKAVEYVRANNRAKKQGDEAEEKSHRTNPNPVQSQEEMKDELDRLADELGLNDKDEDPAKFSPKEVHGESQLPPPNQTNNIINTGGGTVEKDTSTAYDGNREEIAEIQNAIKLSDKIGVRVERLGISTANENQVDEFKQWISQLEMSEDDKKYMLDMIDWLTKLVKLEADKKDIADWVKWQQNSMFVVRDWVHKNKPKN